MGKIFRLRAEASAKIKEKKLPIIGRYVEFIEKFFILFGEFSRITDNSDFLRRFF